MHSLLSGSRCPDLLIVFIIFLLIQMCAGKSYTPVTAQLSSSSSSDPTGYCIPTIGVLGVLLTISFGFNIFLWRKMRHAGGVRESRSAGDPSHEATPVLQQTESKTRQELAQLKKVEEERDEALKSKRELEKQISVLQQTESEIRQELDAMTAQLMKVEEERDEALKSKEELEKKTSDLAAQKTETANFREELLSRLKETEREKSENNKKLQSVERRLENGESSSNMELLEEKGKLSEIKWRLDKKKTDTETLLLYTDKLLQKIKNVIDILSGQ